MNADLTLLLHRWRANTVVNTADIRQSSFSGPGLAIGNFDASRCGFNGPGSVPTTTAHEHRRIDAHVPDARPFASKK